MQNNWSSTGRLEDSSLQSWHSIDNWHQLSRSISAIRAIPNPYPCPTSFSQRRLFISPQHITPRLCLSSTLFTSASTFPRKKVLSPLRAIWSDSPWLCHIERVRQQWCNTLQRLAAFATASLPHHFCLRYPNGLLIHFTLAFQSLPQPPVRIHNHNFLLSAMFQPPISDFELPIHPDTSS